MDLLGSMGKMWHIAISNHRMSCCPKREWSKSAISAAAKSSTPRAGTLPTLFLGTIEPLSSSCALPSTRSRSISGQPAASSPSYSYWPRSSRAKQKETSCSKYSRSWGPWRPNRQNSTNPWFPSTITCSNSSKATSRQTSTSSSTWCRIGRILSISCWKCSAICPARGSRLRRHWSIPSLRACIRSRRTGRQSWSRGVSRRRRNWSKLGLSD